MLLERLQPPEAAAQPLVVVLEDVLGSLWQRVGREIDRQSDRQSDGQSDTACTASNGVLIRCDFLLLCIVP